MVYLLVLPAPGGLSAQVFVMVGAVAQLGEHLLCKQGVSGSIPLSSTNTILVSRRAVMISLEKE
jgi:hypothetical protein